MARKGLGKGLASLIPEFYDEDFDSNSPQSLEDMFNEQENEEVQEENPNDENIFEQLEKEGIESSEDEEEIAQEVSQNEQDTKIEVDESKSEDLSGDIGTQEDLQTPQEVKIQKEHVEEVKQIVDKNPRITLWSSRSSAVFRYLRKTEPEFSISKEASILIDEAVSKKYPEIWALFDDY